MTFKSVHHPGNVSRPWLALQAQARPVALALLAVMTVGLAAAMQGEDILWPFVGGTAVAYAIAVIVGPLSGSGWCSLWPSQVSGSATRSQPLAASWSTIEATSRSVLPFAKLMEMIRTGRPNCFTFTPSMEYTLADGDQVPILS